ncbi:MAG: tetratricopeptide repeat protein [Magnetococcales bacterium]|nr:tetratricopeptide repeat protein [Magnetococcales bacterium]MBF0151173.1 tetratricopeptide repeat protein [Magnetococcales bacterium]MBF0174627.1 tetratricopeptide repeat protein [Magnetococcales bacterium]MBF0348679.1 tetratricopeptide repeat protein [Magnetococcales bacterium]MBF0632655.1 tetratricopeptide repeat protein [Magnetococcales bacterium]
MMRIVILCLSVLSWLGSVAWGWAAEIDDIYALADQKRFPEAMTRLEGYLQKNPKDAQGRFLKGLILTEQKRPDDAIAVFKALSSDHPNLPEPYNNLAVLYAEKGMYEEASESLKKAIRTHPSYATAHENLGDIYSKMASQAYSKALALDAQNRAAQTKLDMIRKLFAQQGTDGGGMPEPKAAEPKAAVAGVAPAAVAAAAPAAAPAPPTAAPDDAASSQAKAEVERSVQQWVKDWSEKNTSGYLSAYSSRFQVPSPFGNRAAWESRRSQVLGQPGDIRVSISDVKVSMLNPGRAQAVFKQEYWSPTYQDSVKKTLSMVLEDGRWKILRESSGG